MERLSGASIQSLMAILALVATARDLPAFRSQLARSLHELVPCDIVSYNEVDLPRGRTTALMDPVESIPSSLLPAFNELFGEHPLINYYASAHDGQAVRLSDFLSPDQFHRLGLYAEFFGKLAIEHQIAFVLPSPAPLIIGLALNRSSRNFDERERTLLNLARPHLVQSFKQAQLLTLMRMGLDVAGQEIVLLRRDDWSFEASDRAADWLARYAADPNSRGDLLPEPVRQWVRAQRSRFTGDDAPALATPLVFWAEDRSRLSIRHLFAGHAAEQDALLLQQHTVDPQPADFASLGLTKRESELLAAVSTGTTNAELASQFSTSERTVEKHLSHIYQKLGVNTRTAAVAVALHAR
jgi:DNA-binding CsgD family transcriptional regulator